MTLHWLIASIHLLALGIGLGAVVARARALRGPLDAARIRAVLFTDTAWGIAAFLWIATGVWRAFGGLEKGSAYYLGNSAFRIKLSLFLGILILEMWPMVTFIRWRITLGKGGAPDMSRADTFSRISMIQAALVIAMVFAATAMARGIGMHVR